MAGELNTNRPLQDRAAFLSSQGLPAPAAPPPTGPQQGPQFPSIQAVAAASPATQPEPPGWFSRLLGAGPQPPVAVPPNTKYPDALDSHIAALSQQTYGDSVDRFLQPGAKIKKMTVDEAKEAYGELTGRAFANAAAVAATPEDQEHIMKNWIAAQKSPISALGFDPGVTVYTPKEGDTKLTLAGFYRPQSDTLWYYGGAQDAVVHESIHRGLQKLREANKLPESTQELLEYMDFDPAGGEEMLVRGLKAKYFGDIEKGLGALGDKQVDAGNYYRTKMGKIDTSKVGMWDSAVKDLERAAADLMAEKKPRGPR